MRNILQNGMSKDLENNEESSKDVTNLFEVFSTHIKEKKFENNDFLFKEDALAVIDLAEACNMFINEKVGVTSGSSEGSGEKKGVRNYKAAGICFNNMANIQFKNGTYDLAAENF